MRGKTVFNSLFAACALSVTTFASAQDLIAYDGFEYPSAPNLYGGNGGIGWASQWFDINVLPTGVSPQTMTWPGMLSRGGCATTAPYPSADFTQYSRALAPYVDPDDTVYISFLLRPNFSNGTTAGLAFGTWTNGMVVGLRPSGQFGLMTPPGTASADSSVASVEGETYLLAIRVKKNIDATTTWSLFVNPTAGVAEPAQPDASLAVPIATLPGAVMIYNDGGFSTDEIRVGHTWMSVVPRSADITGDGLVNAGDLLAVINHWGACPVPPATCPWDISPLPSGDGMVNVSDLLAVINNWG